MHFTYVLNIIEVLQWFCVPAGQVLPVDISGLNTAPKRNSHFFTCFKQLNWHGLTLWIVIKNIYKIGSPAGMLYSLLRGSQNLYYKIIGKIIADSTDAEYYSTLLQVIVPKF